MHVMNDVEIGMISGADAAATRLPGTNSWGEAPPDPYQDLRDCLDENTKYGGGVFGAIRCFWIYGR